MSKSFLSPSRVFRPKKATTLEKVVTSSIASWDGSIAKLPEFASAIEKYYREKLGKGEIAKLPEFITCSIGDMAFCPPNLGIDFSDLENIFNSDKEPFRSINKNEKTKILATLTKARLGIYRPYQPREGINPLRYIAAYFLENKSPTGLSHNNIIIPPGEQSGISFTIEVLGGSDIANTIKEKYKANFEYFHFQNPPSRDVDSFFDDEGKLKTDWNRNIPKYISMNIDGKKKIFNVSNLKNSGLTEEILKELYSVDGTISNKKGVVAISPYYPTYDIIVSKGAGSNLTGIDLDLLNDQIDHSKRFEEEIEAKIKNGEQIGTIMINFPHNPTGKILSEQEAKGWADMVKILGTKYPYLKFVFDEAYTGMDFDGNHHSIYDQLNDKMKYRSFRLYSSSKALGGAASLRVGLIASPNKLILGKIADQLYATVSHASFPSQIEFAKILLSHVQYPDKHQETPRLYQEVLHKLSEALNATLENCCKVPESGLFVLANFSRYKGYPVPEGYQEIVGKSVIENSLDFARLLMAGDPAIKTIPIPDNKKSRPNRWGMRKGQKEEGEIQLRFTVPSIDSDERDNLYERIVAETLVEKLSKKHKQNIKDCNSKGPSLLDPQDISSFFDKKGFLIDGWKDHANHPILFSINGKRKMFTAQSIDSDDLRDLFLLNDPEKFLKRLNGGEIQKLLEEKKIDPQEIVNKNNNIIRESALENIGKINDRLKSLFEELEECKQKDNRKYSLEL